MRTNLKYNILAGLFLLIGLAMAVWGSFFLAGKAPLRWNREFVVMFSLADGTAGLKPGASVNMGGQQIGRVLSIDFKLDRKEGSNRPVAVRVTVQVRDDLELYDNAQVVLERPLLGTIGALNVVDAGDPSTLKAKIGRSELLETGDVIWGSPAPPSFLAQAGIGRKEIDKIKEIIEDTHEVVSGARKSLQGRPELIASTIDHTMKSVNDFADRIPAWSASVDGAVKKIDQGVEKIDPIVEGVQRAVTKAEDFVKGLQAILDRNGKGIDEIIANVNALTSGLAGDVLGNVLAAVRELPGLAQSARKTVEDGQNLVASLRQELPEITRALASTRQAADRAKIGVEEIVAQPWRLFYRPSTRELREQLVYDAARAYAEAMGDLRVATDTLAASGLATPKGEFRPDVDRQRLSDLLEQVKAAASGSKEREQDLRQRLLDLIMYGSDAPKPGARSDVGPGKERGNGSDGN